MVISSVDAIRKGLVFYTYPIVGEKYSCKEWGEFRIDEIITNRDSAVKSVRFTTASVIGNENVFVREFITW